MFKRLKKWVNCFEQKVIESLNQETWVEPCFFSLSWFLLKISYLYGGIVKLRLFLYEKKIFKAKKLSCFVISIGNIVVGGTGKTPMTIYLAKLFKKMGKSVVVVSRGYKGKYKNKSAIVSDGNKIFLDALKAGDEPYMMAEKKAFPIVVGKKKFEAGKKAIKEFDPDVIVLDDGFSHVKLKRDIDLLLFDYFNPIGNAKFLPAGRLRENFSISKKRATAIIFTRCSLISEGKIKIKDEEKAKKVLEHYPNIPFFKTSYKYFVWRHIEKKKETINNIKSLKDKKAILFSGLADNKQFFISMEKLDVNILCHIEFKDHYRYLDHDILKINDKSKKYQVDFILTTQKDYAKLNSSIKWEKDLIVIGIDIQFEYPEKFEEFLNLRLKSKTALSLQ